MVSSTDESDAGREVIHSPICSMLAVFWRECGQHRGHIDTQKEFREAFGDSTGLPLTLRPVEYWQLAHRGQSQENPFCAMIAQTNRGCSYRVGSNHLRIW